MNILAGRRPRGRADVKLVSLSDEDAEIRG